MIIGEPADSQGYTTGMVCRQVAACTCQKWIARKWRSNTSPTSTWFARKLLGRSWSIACSMLLHSAMFQCLHLQEGHVLQIWKLQRSRLADEKLLRMVCAGWWVAQMPWSMHSFLLPPLPSSRALWQGAISHGTSPSKFYKPEPGEIEEVRHNNLSTAYPNWLDFVKVPIPQSEQVERCTVCDAQLRSNKELRLASSDCRLFRQILMTRQISLANTENGAMRQGKMKSEFQNK